jgi:RNA polymerase sigma factor (sigma-70 family)
MPGESLRCVLQYLHEAVGPVEGDEELLERFVRQRDERAFEQLLRKHGPMVLGVCRRIVRDDHAAEDAFQATFLALARKAATIARRSSLGPWLCRVARRAALEVRARTGRHARRERPLQEPVAANAPGPGTEAERAELSALQATANA